jgi:hypothetical protein
VRRSFAVDRFLDEEDAMHPCTTRKEMLRSLKDEVPPQMRQANDVQGVLGGAYCVKGSTMSRGRSFHEARISKIRASRHTADEAGTRT